MSKLINLHVAGAIKQGEKVFDMDFTLGTASVWSVAICKINGVLVAFKKHTSQGAYDACSIDTHANFVRDNQDSPAVLAVLESIKPYCLSSTASAGLAYVTDATETGLYFDGVSKITSAPVKDKSTADILKDALGGSGTSDSGTTTGTGGIAPVWYKKPLNIVLIVAVLIGLGLLVKRFK